MQSRFGHSLICPDNLHCVTTVSKVCCALVTAQHDRLMQGHTSMFCSIGAVGTIASKKRCSCACCRYPRLPSSNTESCNRCRHDKSANEGAHTTSGQQRVIKEPGLKSVPRLRPPRHTVEQMCYAIVLAGWSNVCNMPTAAPPKFLTLSPLCLSLPTRCSPVSMLRSAS